jgi:NADH:ubiquinone oxidoreductase subunit 5 (subunit L)/multisubunit Na+/H+ antiporter MnhA subunit
MLFSEFYMVDEKNKMRFFVLVRLFVLCINLLIFFSSLIILIFG